MNESLYPTQIHRFGRTVNQTTPSAAAAAPGDLSSPHPLISGSPSVAPASSLTGIGATSSSFTNVAAAVPSQPSPSALQMLNVTGPNIIAQYQYFLNAAAQQQAVQSVAASSAHQQNQAGSQLGLSPSATLTTEQINRYLVHLHQQQLSSQMLSQLRGVNPLSQISAQMRNALVAQVNPFPQNAATLAAVAVQQQQQQPRLPAPVPTTVRGATSLSPTPGPSGLQAGKITGDPSNLLPSAFTPNVHGVSTAKAAMPSGSFPASSPDEISFSKSGVRSRQNALASSSLMLPPPVPRSRNPSVALPSTTQSRQRQSALPYQRPPPFASESLPVHSYHPSHFMKGTVIQLQSGQLKRVEDMNTDDFVHSAATNTDLILCYSTVRSIQNAGKERNVIVTFSVGQQKTEVSIEAGIEHPYFVVGQGWASCDPEKTLHIYGLSCNQLKAGDVCIAVYDGGKEEASIPTKISGTESSPVPGSSNSSVDTTSETNLSLAENDDGQQNVQQDDDGKSWRSSVKQPPSSGNNSQSSSDGNSQVIVRERSESSN